MKKPIFKRIASLVLIGAMCFSLNQIPAKAATTTASAEVIPANTFVTTKTAGDNLDNWYKFVMPETGYVEFQFNAISRNPSATVLVCDSDFTVKYQGKSDLNETSPKFGLEKGGVMYVDVNSYDALNFTIMAGVTVANNWEREPNDSFEKANTITAGSTINGSESGNDDDYFKFIMPSNGYVNFTINNPNVNTNNSGINREISAKVYNSARTSLYEYWGYDSQITTQNFASKKGSTYYIYVKPEHGDGEYSITPNFIASNSCESEDNGSFNTANTIQMNKPLTGFLQSVDDVDFYKFQTKKAKKSKNGTIKVSLNLDTPIDKSSQGYDLVLYNNEKKIVKYVSGITDNTEFTYRYKISKKSKTYYVEVKNNTGAVGAKYGIKVNL